MWEALVKARHLGTLAASGVGLTAGRAPTGPLYAQLSICDPCNHRCVMCWDHPPDGRESEWTQGRFGSEAPGVMGLDTFRGIVDDLHALGTRKVELVGRGEPMLNKHAADMVEYAKGKGFYVGMTSNASKLDAEMARRLVAAGMDHLHVSLNAGRPDTYPKIHVTESPESYRQHKRNLEGLAEAKRAAGSELPYVRTAFILQSANQREVMDMVEAAHEVGAQEAAFHHVIVHDATQDLALSRAEYDELLASLPAAQARAEELGVNTNLASVAATPPLYLQEVVTGEKAVPCYVGWYFTVILGNGEVSPCCQCSRTIDRVTGGQEAEGTRFRDVWRSQAYQRFRSAARALPAASDELDGCPCDNCQLRPRNISFHNFFHPFDRIEAGPDEQLYTLSDVLRGRKQRS